jgi:hypothetical protein
MPQYLDRAEAADYLTGRGLKIKKGTLQKYATTGGGPPYRRFGNKTLYTPDGLDQWAEGKMSAPRRSTSEAERDGNLREAS